MKQVLLPENGAYFKANLHCHSTVSDGSRTPEELRDHYRKHGYSIIAYTDHNQLVDHSDLNLPDFLALRSYEIDINDGREPDWNRRRVCHLCLIAKDASVEAIPFSHGAYTPAEINDVIRRAKDAGFLVHYNHPEWSLEGYPEYGAYEGMNAVEIWNTGCERVGFNEYDAYVYDALLRQDKRIFCIATDDNHNREPFGSPLDDSCGGWVMLCCESLTYENVIAALEQGNYYASTGPEILGCTFEDGQVVVKTGPAHRINYISGSRHTEAVGANYGESVTEARFPVGKNDGYFRIDVIDDYGRHANTNAYFVDALYY